MRRALSVLVTLVLSLALWASSASAHPMQDAAVESGKAAVVAEFLQAQADAFYAEVAARYPSNEWWDCIAWHEQNGDWTAHSSTFSSALGIRNQAIRENAPTPEIAQRILNGTATRQEQIDTANNLYSWAGPGAWSTSRSC